jgi:hypothetical protein
VYLSCRISLFWCVLGNLFQAVEQEAYYIQGVCMFMTSVK